MNGNGEGVGLLGHDWPENGRQRSYPERRLCGPVLDYFLARGWYVVFDPDGADFLDVLMVRPDPDEAKHETEVMVLELKVHAAQKAFIQARQREKWADYVAVVLGSYESAQNALDRMDNGGWDTLPKDMTPVAWKEFEETYGDSHERFKGVGLYAVRNEYGGAPREPYLVELRRPRKVKPKKGFRDTWEKRHLRAVRWTKLYRRNKPFARTVAYGYLMELGFKTTHRIPIGEIDAMAEGAMPIKGNMAPRYSNRRPWGYGFQRDQSTLSLFESGTGP